MIGATLAPEFEGSRFQISIPAHRRSASDLEIVTAAFSPARAPDRGDFLRALETHFSDGKILLADFKITGVHRTGESLATTILYEFVTAGQRFYREQRSGSMELQWTKGASGEWQITRWPLSEESHVRSARPMFQDVTGRALGQNSSYERQLAKGTDYWRSILDGASGIDIYGNYGVAFGDFDGDGWDDLYVCQPSGLPNRLYRNLGDGTFEDVTDHAGVGVLDSCPCALFADLDNDGRQDLVVVTGSGPLLFANQGGGRFRLNERAFEFATKPAGTFTGAAVADFDRDGWLDIYFCVYSYYQGPDRYRYPVPYATAENGPPNFLFRNNRNGTFTDATRETRLDVNNNRFSFACGWCDYDQDGWPDLFVANDFGQKNLYHNNGDGTFTDVAREAGVLDTGAGMSICWFDPDHRGQPDLYVADMWSAAGLRVTAQRQFMPDAPPAVRNLYREHSMGNALFRNTGRGTFADVTAASGTGMGRWAWSSDAWDFDQDGYDDLYIANGMISSTGRLDLSSFFWRQVVERSPLNAIPTSAYEQGWNAINELIRSDGTWSGYQRNVLYANNHDGTFTDVSGVTGLDCIEDSRSFALADIDHDGRLEIVIKNRSAPQVRVFRNVTKDLGNSVAFRLTGSKGNRDAIGASVRIRSERGEQVKWLSAGSGFLAQHSKKVFFGLGTARGPLEVTVRWPNGAVENFARVPVNHRIEIEEGKPGFHAIPYAKVSALDQSSARERSEEDASTRQNPYRRVEQLPTVFSSWLLAPIEPPAFSLPDLSGQAYSLNSRSKEPLALVFWMSPGAEQLLAALERGISGMRAQSVALWAVNVDDPRDEGKLRQTVKQCQCSFPILLATPDVAALYNLLFRYTFDRRRNLELPSCFLLDADGMIVKIYQGDVNPSEILSDARQIPQTAAERVSRSLPFRGAYYGGEFTRNDFTYGVIFAQHGYAKAAEAAFLRAIRNQPSSADAYYDLGTLYMQQEKWAEAAAQLRKAAGIEPRNLMALNNLGVIAAHEGRPAEAESYFRRALQIDPSNELAIGNLADLDRAEGRPDAAEKLLTRALERQPENASLNYKLGMLYAKSGQNPQAEQYLRKAIEIDPGNAEAMDNLGVLFAMTGRSALAVQMFSRCIRVAPAFDQAYFNLARVELKLGKPEAAAAVLRALLKAAPGNALALEYLKRLGQ